MSKGNTQKGNGRSAFGPLILIAIGAFFLLNNLGRLPDPNWAALFQLWPLALILIGVNLVVQQAPRQVSGFLSALVGLTAVLLAGYVLFFSEDNKLLSRFGIRTAPTVMQIQEIAFAPDDISKADVELNFNSMGGDIFALEPNEGLVKGIVAFTDNLIFESVEEDDGEASVLLDTGNVPFWEWFGNDDANGQRWEIGLNPGTPLDLKINSGAGSINFDLDDLNLLELDIDLGAGSGIMTLPNGEYEMNLDMGAGSTEIVFPANGRIQSEFEGGAGRFDVVIPEGMPARIEFDSGAGGINLDERFQLIEGERNDDGIWETADYTENGDGIDLKIDVGAGSVNVRDG